MVEPADTKENKRKPIGWKEALGGAVAGTAGGIEIAQVMDGGITGKLDNARLRAIYDAEDEFRKAQPQETPGVEGYLAWREKWENKLSEETKKATAPIDAKAAEANNYFKKPLLLFKEGNVGTRVTLGAVIIAVGLAAGYCVRKFRDSSHVNQIDRERVGKAFQMVAMKSSPP